VWVEPFRRSTLDMIGDGLTLFVGSEGASAWQRAAGIVAEALSVSWVPLQPLTARSLGVTPTGALLARPDGVPIAHWWTAADAPRRLAGAVADLLGGPLESASPRSAA
ncbi:MAG: hypothetical protein ACRDO2_13135, partial [Nocardioidaceae bacterium]